MKIKIQFYEDDDAIVYGEPTLIQIADSVLDAEGKLAIMARQYQKLQEAEKEEGDRGPEDNEASREPVQEA